MKLYIEFIKNAFQVNTAYRLNIFLRLFNQVISLLIWISIWRALFRGSTTTTSIMGIISLNEMVTYCIVSGAISILLNNNVIPRIDQKISTGEIAMDLIKPFSFKANLFCETIGNIGFRTIFELTPLLSIGIIFFGLSYPFNIVTSILFFLTLGNGIIIHFMISYILGLTGFWYLRVWHFRRLLEDFVRIFSGALIPLWFFPSYLILISKFLPFKLIYFTPISIYLGKTNHVEAIQLIIQQFFWIGCFLLIEKIIWLKGIRKLVIQGG